MSSFNSPRISDLSGLQELIEKIPSPHKLSLASKSKAALERVCDADALHIWETDSDLDDLSQLTFVIGKLLCLGEGKEKKDAAADRSMIIIAEERSDRKNFARICELVAHLSDATAKKRLEGTVCVFNKIIVVRGWNNSIVGSQKEALDKTVSRVNIAIEHGLKQHGGKKQIVWHHGAVVLWLNYWINSTTRALRNALHAITVTGALDLTSSVAPSSLGRTNKPDDLIRFDGYATRLNIPVVFLDASSQLLTLTFGTYMYYFAYYIHTLLPPSLREPHLHKGLNDLVTFCFRLRGATEHNYNDNVTSQVKKQLLPSKAKSWAKKCITSTSYTKDACRNTARPEAIHNAVLLAYDPFAKFDGTDASAFARLAVGPAVKPDTHSYIAAPIKFDFKDGKLRMSSGANFHVLVPSPSQNLDKVTSRVQGFMMGCLARVLEEKGRPAPTDEQKEVWKAVIMACNWALEGCDEKKMPSGVKEKVQHVQDCFFRKGVYSFSLGVPGQKGNVPTAAPAPEAAPVKLDADMLRSYGFGQQFGQPQQQQPVQSAAPNWSHQLTPQAQAKLNAHVQGQDQSQQACHLALQTGFSQPTPSAPPPSPTMPQQYAYQPQLQHQPQQQQPQAFNQASCLPNHISPPPQPFSQPNLVPQNYTSRSQSRRRKHRRAAHGVGEGPW